MSIQAARVAQFWSRRSRFHFGVNAVV